MAKQPTKSTKPSAKAAPRASSRSAVRRQERESERRRRRIITFAVIAIVIVVAAGFIFAIVNAPAEAPIPEVSLARYADLTVSRDEDGFPRLGAANAPIKVVEYASFDCSHCREFHEQTADALVERVRAGYISFTYVPLYGYGSIVNGQGAAKAALCAAQQNRFWEFHDALFDWQGRYVNQAFTNNRILSGVDALGLNRSTYSACVSSGTEDAVLNAARTRQQGLLNFSGTPTVTINGIVPLDENQQPLQAAEAIIARIDAEIARLGSLPATPEATLAVEATAEATLEPTAEATEVEAAATEAAEATPEATAAS